MSKNIFITGTGTDIGKTYVTGLIIKKLYESGVNVAYYKAALSGNEKDENGKLIPLDAKHIKEVSNINQPIDEMCPYVYEVAVSPHLASRIEGNPVDMEVVKNGFEEVCQKYDYVTMEGSGGIICPITWEVEAEHGKEIGYSKEEHSKKYILLEDIIHELNLPCLIIADAGLGTINSVVLTVEYMKNHNLDVRGIIFNNYKKGNVMHEDNLYMCEQLTGVKVIAKVCEGDKDLDIDVEELKKIYE